MMKRSSLPREINALLAVGNAIAETLAERQDDREIHMGVEALLRAGIAAAEYAIDAYMAMLAAADKSAVARYHLTEARSRCDQSIRQLKRRVRRSIAHMRRHAKREELVWIEAQSRYID
ncbi:MAG TPA: hypothetical protein VGK48_06495 [Terriglobia bacterium]|jgi:hypothetical protein